MAKKLIVEDSVVDQIIDSKDCRKLLPFLKTLRDHATRGCCGRRYSLNYGNVKRSLGEQPPEVLVQLKAFLGGGPVRFIYRLDGKTVTKDV